jgi:hypothetical protein
MEERVVVRTRSWKLRRTRPPRERFHDHHKDGVVRYCFAGKQRRALVVRIVPEQTYAVKNRRHDSDGCACSSGAEHAIETVEVRALAEVRHGLRTSSYENRRASGNK